jgi:Flp pilus assembly protein protease CpaA
MGISRQCCSNGLISNVLTQKCRSENSMALGIDISGGRFIAVSICSLIAVAGDLRRRRIPNPLCVCLFAVGVSTALWEFGFRGLESSLLGAVAGFCAFLIFYLAGGMGGGDLKLMAAYGAVLGTRGILLAALIAAAAGALLALGYIGAATLRKHRVASIPYAPAIVFGALAVLLSESARSGGGH